MGAGCYKLHPMNTEFLLELDTPEKIAAAILANVGDFWEGRETYEKFSERANLLHRHAEARGWADEVRGITIPPRKAIVARLYCNCWLCDNTGPEGRCLKCGRMPSPDRHKPKGDAP